MSETLDNVTVENKRPTFLTVLCILSFVAFGFYVVGLLLLTVLAAAVVTAAGDQTIVTTAEGDAAVAFGTSYLLIGLVLVVVGFIGVIQMWKLKKSGFYLYVVYGVGSIVLPIAFGAEAGYLGIAFTVAFIAMYAANLKVMR